MSVSSISHAIPSDPSPIEENTYRQDIINFARSLMADDHFYPLEQMAQSLEKYSKDDLSRIYTDFQDLYTKTFTASTAKERTFLVTAGGPTSGKSTLLEKTIEGKNYAYIDPDRTCLFHMDSTYHFDLLAGSSPTNVYDKWREASIFISNVFIAHALNEGYAIAFGSTLTAPDRILDNFLGGIRNYGYEITILHVTSPDEVRYASETARRERGVIQCTDKDFEEKGKAFYQKLPVFTKYATKIEFYFRDDKDGDCKCAGELNRNELTIKDSSVFNSIEKLHNPADNESHFFYRAFFHKD